METPDPTIHTQEHERNPVILGRALFEGLSEAVRANLRDAAHKNAAILHDIAAAKPPSGERAPNNARGLPVHSANRSFPALEGEISEILAAQGTPMESGNIHALSNYSYVHCAESGTIRSG